MAIRIQKIMDKYKNVIDKYCKQNGKRCVNEKTDTCLDCSVYSGRPGITAVKFVAV